MGTIIRYLRGLLSGANNPISSHYSSSIIVTTKQVPTSNLCGLWKSLTRHYRDSELPMVSVNFRQTLEEKSLVADRKRIFFRRNYSPIRSYATHIYLILSAVKNLCGKSYLNSVSAIGICLKIVNRERLVIAYPVNFCLVCRIAL